MEIGDIKVFVEILIAIGGVSSVAIWWKRATNQKKVDDVQARYDKLRADYIEEKEHHDKTKEAYKSVTDLIDFNEAAAIKDPDFAQTLLDYLARKQRR